MPLRLGMPPTMHQTPTLGADGVPGGTGDDADNDYVSIVNGE